MLKPKQKIPMDIVVKDKNGKEVTLQELIKQPTVLYFYPKDNTPGCTLEAQTFQQLWPQIKELGVNLFGISKDSPASHRKFAKKQNIKFSLLSDQEHQLQEALGVWQEKRMFGKTYMGTVRSTFVVDEDGQILKVWKRVAPKGHAREVLDYLKQEFA